jgi:hypothetical protein
MRVAMLGLALLGCGAVRLGDEAPWGELDAEVGARADRSMSPGIDAGMIETPLAVVTVNWLTDCADCAQLQVEGIGGEPPYEVEWGDGESGAARRVCGDELARPLAVVVTDALGARSVPHLTRLAISDASCPVDAGALVGPRICLQNPSFEGTPGFNSGVPTMFDAAPWSVCTNPSVSNTPEIANETVGQAIVSPVPLATHGKTWLGLAEKEQVSQALCRGVSGGTSLSFRIDLSRIYVGANVVPDTEAVFLEIWGGTAADCSARELLWASPKLDTVWNTYCVTVRPKEYFDNLVLRSRSDESLPSTTYLIADNIVPVESCF